jgi:hypothetical protein
VAWTYIFLDSFFNLGVGWNRVWFHRVCRLVDLEIWRSG